MIAILHCDKLWGIGKDNKLMFSLPADMKFFRETTTGNVVVMGANTLRSFPAGKPLKNRTNIVLSTTLPERDDMVVVRSMDDLKKEIAKYPQDKVYVIGGERLYKALLPYCQKVLVTKVDAVGNADTFFPDLDKDPSFAVETSSEEMETGGFTIRFVTYQNKHPKPLE